MQMPEVDDLNPAVFEAAARRRCLQLARSAIGTTQLLLFGVQSISEVDADKWFVPNDPRVMPRRNRPHIARTKLCFGAVVHSDHDPPREDVDQVANLATVGPNSRFDTLRPAPSRLMSHAPDLDTPQVHGLDLALVKGSCFFRSIKALFHDLCHVAPPIQLLQILHPVRAEIQALFCTQAPRTDQPILVRRYPI
jgi:hypothetical protein